MTIRKIVGTELDVRRRFALAPPSLASNLFTASPRLSLEASGGGWRTRHASRSARRRCQRRRASTAARRCPRLRASDVFASLSNYDASVHALDFECAQAQLSQPIPSQHDDTGPHEDRPTRNSEGTVKRRRFLFARGVLPDCRLIQARLARAKVASVTMRWYATVFLLAPHPVSSHEFDSQHFEYMASNPGSIVGFHCNMPL